MLAIVGCGGDRTPVSSATSKYEVADGDNSGPSPAANPGSTINPAASVQPSYVPPSDAIRPASDSPEDLMQYVSNLARSEPTGTSQAEVLADIQRIQEQIVSVCERVLEMEAPEEVKLAAAHSELSAFSQMMRMGHQSAAQRMQEFVVKLNASKEEALQTLAFEVGFANMMNALRMGGDVDPLAVMKDLERLVGFRDKNIDLLQIGTEVAAILERAEHSEQAIEAFQLLAEAFKDVKDESLIEAAAGLTERAHLLESNITTILSELLQGNDEMSAKFVTAAQGLLQADDAGLVTLDFFQQVAPTLEMAKPEVAGEIYAAIYEAFKTNSNAELAKMAEQTWTSYERRTSLVGNPFSVEGTDLAGLKFDWTKYEGKVVLVDFWATWCAPCLEEIPNIRENYDRYHDQGFEVVGVNMDEDMQSLRKFIEFYKVPWPSVLGDDPSMRGWDHPMIEKYGVTALPFLVLVGRDGIALATNVRGDALDEKLAELFPAGDTKPAPVVDADAAPASTTIPAPSEETDPAAATSDPATSDPATPTTPVPKPAATDPGDGAKADEIPSRYRGVLRESGFMGITAPAILTAGPRPRSSAAATVEDGDDEINTDEESEINPYSPPSGLSPLQLVDFIFSMQEKPLSIQRRPGFMAAIVEAADQVLAAKASDQFQIVAAEAKFEVLHQAASLGDSQADKQLDAFVDQMQGDERERIAKQVRFFVLEQKALGADEIPLDAVPGLLAELQTYFDSQKLTGQHLRIASATVHAINRMTDNETREKYFTKFGTRFATSKDRVLASYGRRIGRSSPQPVIKLVGKPLELKGITTLGTEFDWETYRGKIVVVDFWATWCGPCRAETPHLKALAKTSDKLAIVAISLDKDLEAVERYLDQNQIEWANLVGDEARQIAAKYGIRAIPTMLVVDAEGNVVAVGNKVAQIQTKLQQLLAG
jgi:thiol-disulfide isomerase/thioredoxin